MGSCKRYHFRRDNGLGVATIMAILESTDISHPAIEALFTIDEETGMTGAMV
ncbi:aminoacyl-histidine dipeptidase [Algibacter lectus]|uniref:Aminoacyl-histidine dipeptidase n=1 Tax=Algibacter lectus TaxID=221126 RepID=A0A090WPK5_9FLAO|nr:aminoacyl-histidine dipeptidase [Algibacter lectus]